MAAGHKLSGRSAQWPEVALQASRSRTLLLVAGSVGLSLLVEDGLVRAHGG